MSDKAYAKILKSRSPEYYGESDDDESSSEDESDDNNNDDDEEEEEVQPYVKCGSRDLHILLLDKNAGLNFSTYVNPYDFDLIK